MANTKEIFLRARVPFDWASQLTDEEARVWVAWGIGPHSFDVSYTSAGYVPTDNGGRCAMYEITISGTEAYKTGALAIIRTSLERQRYATLIDAYYIDLDYDDSGDAVEWPTVEQDQASRERAKEQVAQMMEGKRFVTRTVREGITESKLWPVDEPAPEGWS